MKKFWRIYQATAIVGILPGGIVAVSYILVMIGRFARTGDAETGVVLAMAIWGVLGVVELWHEYTRLSKQS